MRDYFYVLFLVVLNLISLVLVVLWFYCLWYLLRYMRDAWRKRRETK